MKLSNFVFTKKKGSGIVDYEYFGEVDIETGVLWWKKTTRKQIRREYAGSWHFVDSGEFTPGYQVENLVRSWEAKNGKFQ